jgi:ribonuclease-3
VKASALENLDHLEIILKYRFRDHVLLTQAMTHRSWAHEQVSPRAQKDARNLHNEALEFLGDSVLGLIVADYLFKAYPHASEGELSRMKHRLVSAPTLARASAQLQLGEFLRFGRGEEKSGGRRKHALLADVFEAVTGAIFIDGGLEAARDFVTHALGEDLRTADPVAAGKVASYTSTRAAIYRCRDPGPAAQTHVSCRAEMGWRNVARRRTDDQSR